MEHNPFEKLIVHSASQEILRILWKTNVHYLVRFHDFSSASMKFRVFWDVAPCSKVDVDRRFRGAHCLHHQGVLMMEVALISETSANINLTTRRYIPEDSKLLSLSCSQEPYPEPDESNPQTPTLFT
jgi:hypothetical protein